LLALECLCALMKLLCAADTGLLILSRVSSRSDEFAVRIAQMHLKAGYYVADFRLAAMRVCQPFLLIFSLCPLCRTIAPSLRPSRKISRTRSMLTMVGR
jgi:hypothetical protein